MADISKCGNPCEVKDICFRHTAKSGIWQSYVNFGSEDNKICDFFKPNSESELTCSCNGVKREGESCTLNNKCSYPKCLE